MSWEVCREYASNASDQDNEGENKFANYRTANQIIGDVAAGARSGTYDGSANAAYDAPAHVTRDCVASGKVVLEEFCSDSYGALDERAFCAAGSTAAGDNAGLTLQTDAVQTAVLSDKEKKLLNGDGSGGALDKLKQQFAKKILPEKLKSFVDEFIAL